MAETDYVIYTDGGCLVNPDGPGGLGVVLRETKTGMVVEMNQAFESTTNNRMEIRAVIVALERVPKGSTVMLYSDSQYVVNTATGRFRENKNQDLWARLHRAEAGKKITYNWVRGHNGDPLNERCDELATLAMQTLKREEDEGYAAQKATASGKEQSGQGGGRERVGIKVPEAYSAGPDAALLSSPEAYADHYSVHAGCAAAICRFYVSGGRGFRDYASLKTGGMDSWSKVRPEELVETCGQDAWDVAFEYLNNEKDVATCLKWYCRGLKLEDAIRKVQVDKEVGLKARR